MSGLLQPVLDELDAIIESLKVTITTAAPLSISSGNWSFPGVTKSDLINRTNDLRTRVADAVEPSTESEAAIAAIVERLTFLRTHTFPQLVAQAASAVPAFFITLDAVEKLLSVTFTDTKAQALKNSHAVKKATIQVRSLETRLRDLTPRTKTLDEMVGRIEKAHDAADQLPTDLETLAESQKKVSDLLSRAEGDKALLASILSAAEHVGQEMDTRSAEAKEILERCESAYSSATSLGLAAAFSERSKALDNSMWGWVGGLVASLLIGGAFGSWQLRNLAEALANPQAQGLTIGVNLVLSVLSVGGPIWFAWLATKQIGQRFRLSEDYAFKASISRAYEGYRREAARIDPDLEYQLLQSALSRLDEQPLRLVESASYGSPWHELLSSDVVKDAAKTIPGFVDKVMGFANESLDRVKLKKNLVAANSDLPPSQPESDKA
ncbi:hypothetical protein [Pseudomonas syringae]|uniref:Large permease component n=3 Tax=Pseudomonas syringae group TaxID=136849 RepID=A0A2V0QFC4_PSESF|nr:hypothetical protein [Pseudomonas syringae]EPN16574.1 hypothetical protein A259_13949 [Pseudomonas syringae pv. actinidiae ICMP 19070]AQL38655.1 hypothetical protein JN853_20955 [Pseudomonas syringae pv. actinidiae ICMP 9853]AYL82249.1 hypothetical protein CN228_22195 [Pseudomonas syringae pv. actinidiae str. Shaanxi_M228]EGH67044.1 hypothetical protein PSYAC_19470 [Pseudomonas syringae pv. actinidiae str. M302091]EPM51090.1 hypothetical protein A256_16570 [Pseudomonas syringae pv. actinidi